MLFENDRRFCCYCGERIRLPLRLTIEHLVPRSKGGKNSPDNRRSCCHVCNNDKGNKRLSTWLVELRKRTLNSADAEKYKLFAMIENVEHWIEYIQQTGEKLYKSKDAYMSDLKWMQ